jgi:hypothetical protein
VPEGDKKDDLFEDLDKFFAPIQDVDWPENPSTAPPGEQAPPDPDTAVIDEPDDSASAGSIPRREDPFEESSASEERSEESVWGEEEEAEISEETFGRAPSAYVDLPGPSEEAEGEPEVDSTFREASA